MNNFCFREKDMASSSITSMDDFKQILRNTTGSMIHCAVQRKCYMYKHHYIALCDTFCDKCNTCDIIHFAKDGCWREGRVKRVKHYDIQIDINKGLCVYQNDGYPRNNDDYSKAYKRFQKLQSVNRSYSFSVNKCEHIVNYILTGHAVSYQLRNGSILKRFLSECIDLLTEGLCQNISVAVINGLATSLFMIWFLHFNYLQIKNLFDKENKRRWIFGKFINGVVSWIRSIFKNKNSVNDVSPDEQRFFNTLVYLLILDPDEVTGSTYAKARLQKAARWLRYFATGATVILTFIVEGFFSFLTSRSLKRDLKDNFNNHEDFKRQIKHAILFVFRVIFTSLIIAFLIFNDKKHFFHPITAFLYGFIGNIASRVIVPGTMEVCCILYRFLSNS